MGTKGDVKERLMACLRELHLPTFRECFEELARRAVQETASYEQYLLDVAERECQARLAKRTERLLRDSRLPLEKDLASFDMSRLPAKVSRQVRTLLDGSFVDRRENLLMFGKAGSGKTHLLSAIGQELVRSSGRKVISWPCALLVQELLVAKRDLKLSRVLKRLFVDFRGHVENCPTVQLPDIGTVGQLDSSFLPSIREAIIDVPKLLRHLGQTPPKLPGISSGYQHPNPGLVHLCGRFAPGIERFGKHSTPTEQKPRIIRSSISPPPANPRK
jgi:hypothetical protein